MRVVQEVSFPDHHFYTDRQLANIFKIADKNNALVVTTEKDYVKLSKSLKEKIYPINIELHLSKKERASSGTKKISFLALFRLFPLFLHRAYWCISFH